MPSIIFDQDTSTNPNTVEEAVVPPTKYLNAELKKCFYDASIIFNKHTEVYPTRWNYCPAAKLSAYLNLVSVLYCKLTGLLVERCGDQCLSSKDMHSMSRYLHTIATTYYSSEIEILNDMVNITSDWNGALAFRAGYNTKGLQMLRDYNLLSYVEGDVTFSGKLQDFIYTHKIKLARVAKPVELKYSRVVIINDSRIEIPEKISSETLKSSIELINQIATTGAFGYSITNVEYKDEIKILRRGTTCDIKSLSNKELSTISSQLEESPELLKKLLRNVLTNGSVS